MQFEINKSPLVKILSNVIGVVEKRNITIPILLNVKIEARDGKLILTATDIDIVVISTAEALIINNGQTTVSAQLFYDIVRKIPDNNDININIELENSGNALKIKYGKSKFSLPSLDPAEFPALSEGNMISGFKINASELARIIDKTRFAISNDETRHYLNGLFLHIVENAGHFEVKTVATDGHRLALSFSQASNLKEPISGVIIPRKTINEIRRIIDNFEEVEIAVSQTKIKVICGNSIIISKLIDGEFPDYNKVVPKHNNQVVKVNKRLIFDAIDRVATITSDKHRSIKFILDNGKIILQVNSSEGGFADEEVEVDFNGNRIEVGFNSRYLLEIINQIDKEQVNFKFKDGVSPALIDSDGSKETYVIMPIRI